MGQSRQKLIEDIVCRSSTIYERKQFPFIPIPSNAANLIQHRLVTWQNALHQDGKPEEFDKYLNWQKIDMEVVVRMLSPVRLENGAPLPGWAKILEKVLAVAEDSDFWIKRAPSLMAFVYNQDTSQKEAKQGKRVPFDVLFTPFLDVIQSYLSTAIGYDLLSLATQQAVLSAILRELANTASDAIYTEFHHFREKQPFGALIQLVAKAKVEPPDTTYKQFIQIMQQGGFIGTLRKYPVLARLLCHLSLTWIKTQSEFLANLTEDMEEIQRVFWNGEQCGKVALVSLSLSDRHHGGYSVIALTFESGLKLVYKPKDLKIEATYNQFLRWMNELGSPIDFYPIKTLVRGSHGWVEFVEYQPCHDQQAVIRFYQRMGALLCLVYALEGTDCHQENIIACSEHPVLIDAETLFHHRVEEQTTEEIGESAAFKTSLLLSNSVLRVGLLPGWQMGANRKIVNDFSGLGGLGEQDTHFYHKRFLHINTDAMEIVSESGGKPPDKNIPFFEDGSPFRFEKDLDLYIDAISTGFEQVYRFLIQKRAELITPGSTLTLFQNKQIRFIFRASHVYFTLSHQARQIRNLKDGIDYSLYLERLARAHLQVEDKPSCFPLLAVECKSLIDLDIPFFTASTSSRDIELMTNQQEWVVKNYFMAPSYTYTIDRLGKLSEEDLSTQLQIIRSSMYSRFAHLNENQPGRSTPPNSQQDISHQIPIQPATTLHQALTIARRILAQAIGGRDGSLSWFGNQIMPESDRFSFGGLGLSIYDGVAGIGLFLAGLEKVLQLPEYRASGYPSLRAEALAAIVPIRQALKDKSFWENNPALAGCAAGIGSFIYALLRIGKFLNEPGLIEEALEATQRITPEIIKKDDALDIISGGAGFILCMLALYNETKNPTALEHALSSGWHLLSKRITTDKGFRCWKVFSNVPLAGFSHGAAGFAYPFLQLYRLTHEKEFLEAAKDAIAYENTLFCAQESNWQDKREGNNLDSMVAWCHGAAGIGLQRVYSLDVLDTPQIRQDIEAAIVAIQRQLASLTNRADHLCCGNIGRIEALWSIGSQLNRPGLIQYAKQAAALLVENAAEKGGYQYSSFLPRSMFSPTLFQGAAGIGYGLLRLTYPLLLPNPIIWE